jgi:class 3 adenylate cyclase/tetratricopeptide (TPR) repeat protein
MRTLLPGDNPQAYIPEDRRRALARGVDLPTLSHGSALFVDIAGYTPLAETFARTYGARRGAEEVTATLDRVFAALIESMHGRDASVIYFSGDAVTAWIEGDDGAAAVACGLEMQQVMARVGTLTAPDGTTVVLGLKVAVSVGRVHRFVVGDPRIQLIDVLAGRLMDSLAAAEQVSVAGEVVLDEEATASLEDRVKLLETRSGALGPVGVVHCLVDDAPEPSVSQSWPRLPDTTARGWLLPAVWERMVAGRGEFLADLRPGVPVFVRFGGLDFEGDPAAPGVLDDFVTRAQRVLDEHGGSILQLTIGDKGAYLYGAFGAPIAHEDDATRACDAALRLLESAGDLPVRDVQIGLATGRLRSGTYGHAERRTFCCLGDPVNLAARLMSRAGSGEIWVHGDVAAQTGERFSWTELPATRVKGREEPVAVRALRGHRARHVPTVGADPTRVIVGRDRELARLWDLWAAAAHGRGQVVVVQAEAGTGKSRLVRELTDALAARGVPVFVGEATPLATQASYAAWRDVWAGLLGVDEHAAASVVTSAVATLDPQLAGRAPLLGPVLGLSMPDSDLTASFDGELRKTSLEDLLTRLLATRAAQDPLVLVIEDAHWLDPLSRDLLEALTRTVSGRRILLVVITRPDGTALAGLPIRPGDHVTDLELAALDPDAARALVAERHRALVARDPSPELVDAVVGRAEGNPFYLEQLVEYVLAHTGAEGAEALELPASLHSLVLSRIDAQAEGSRRAVKVASVIGRDFRTPLVAAAYPDLGVEDAVHDDLLGAAGTRLIALENPAARAWAFGHAVTRDVAYDSLPFSTRRVLHGRVGDALESEPDGPRRHLNLLAYHYAHSEDLPKKRRYLKDAAAAARAAYAQQTAISYLEQVLPIVDADERVEVLLQLAEAQEIGGDWGAAEDNVARARAAAEEVGDVGGVARARVARGELARKQGRYAEAEEELSAAEVAFAEIGDTAGRGRVLNLRGTLESQQGHPDLARAAYEESLALRRELGDDAGVAAMLSNLAVVAEHVGDLDEAERLGEEALERRRDLGDQRAVSVSLTNMGMLATTRGDLPLARGRFLEAQELAEAVGDPWVVAVGRHNSANVSRDLGDLASAASDFRLALDGYVERDDLWSVAHLFEDAALLAIARGEEDGATALFLVAAAERLREEIGAPRFAPTQAALDAALAPARLRDPAEVLDRASAEGAAASLPHAVARAVALLTG